MNRHGSITAASSTTASPAAVWEALTTRRAAWWPEMRFEPIVGAPLRETWQVDGVELAAEGTVTEVDPGSALAFTWTEPGWPHPLAVRVVIEPRDGRTSVTLTESGFGDFDDDDRLSREHLEGWSFHLGRLCGEAEAASS